MNKKKRRPSARRIPVHLQELRSKDHKNEDYPEHPIFWVECSGCGREVPQALTIDGKAALPPGWATIFPTDRSSSSDHPDVYASEPCTDHAATLLALRLGKDNITVHRVLSEPLEYIEVNMFVDPKP